MNTLFLSSFFLSSLQCVVCLNCTFQQPLSPVTHLWCSPTRIFWIDTGGFSSVHFSSVAQLCLTLCDPMDCSLLGSSVHGIFQSRVLEWVAIAFSKESWVPKNWCFWTVVLQKSLVSPLDSKEIKSIHPKGNQSWIFIERTDAEASILRPPDVKNWVI